MHFFSSFFFLGGGRRKPPGAGFDADIFSGAPLTLLKQQQDGILWQTLLQHTRICARRGCLAKQWLSVPKRLRDKIREICDSFLLQVKCPAPTTSDRTPTQQQVSRVRVGRHVGSSELSADCSYKDQVRFVPTKNLRTSNLVRTFFEHFLEEI